MIRFYDRHQLHGLCPSATQGTRNPMVGSGLVTDMHEMSRPKGCRARKKLDTLQKQNCGEQIDFRERREMA